MRVSQRSTAGIRANCLLLSIVISGFLQHLGAEWRVAEAASWRTGSDFQRQLDLPISVSWTNLPLRQATQSLSESHQVAIWIDRRIDPDQPITISRRAPLVELLEAIGQEHDFAVGTIDSVLYLGPSETTRKLATLSEQASGRVRDLPPAARRKWLQRSRWQWKALAEPRQLLGEHARRYRIEIENLAVIPHDLFRAADLPALRSLDKVMLIAAGFGKTVDLSDDGKRCRLVQMPDLVSIRRSYAVTADRRSSIDRLRAKIPEAKLQMQGSRLQVEGLSEDHQHVQRWLNGAERVAPAKAPMSVRRFTLRAENQRIIDLVKAVARNVGYTLSYGPSLETKLAQRTSIAVENARFEEVMRQLLEPIDVRYDIEEAKLMLEPK